MRRRSFDPVFWALANLGSRVRYTPPVAKTLTTAELPEETSLSVPTRHGALRAVLVRPAPSSDRASARPPVVIQLHGGGFLNRCPEQDRHVARFLAAELGVVVVLPDYSTAPKARYPVAEEEMYDVASWVQRAGEAHGWDGTRLLLSGISAGAKLAINVCQQIHAHDGVRPLAVSLVVPVTDMSTTDRTAPVPRPAISPFVQRLVAWAYFPDPERRREALAAPRYDPHLAAAMPPTLVQTAEHDTLAPEGAELTRTLRDAGVRTVHRQHEKADHGFYSSKPVARVAGMLTEVVTFFREQLDAHAGGTDETFEVTRVSSYHEDVVRSGYDAVSERYRADDDAPAGYEDWLLALDGRLPARADVLDLGCGCGVPMARRLTDLGHRVLGVDTSRVQIDRARRLVPDARFVQAGAADLVFEPGSFDAIVCLFMLIHLPQHEQETLVHRFRTWLRPRGVLVATVGAVASTGEEADWLGGGAPMWWSNPGADTYREWLAAAGLLIEHDEFVPEGDGGHQLFIARVR